MNIVLKIVGVLVLVVIVAAVVFIIMFKPKQYTDYGRFTALRSMMTELLQSYGAQERPITDEFRDFTVKLAFPFSMIFGSREIAIPVKSYENEKLAVATISQFQVPPKSDYYRDFTINIRPRYGVKAPVMHMDFMKPAPGTSGMCIVDFFNVDKDAISYEEFFGDSLETVTRALAMVKKYQRSAEDGRGEITGYLDPYKSPYRFELTEPGDDNPQLREQYYTTVSEAVGLLLPAYLKSVHSATLDSEYAGRHEQKIKEFVRLVYANDFAVRMGRKMLKEDFRKYWLDGFWNVDVELPQ